MYLIPSAAYIDLEFQAELGKLPPCLLPVANQRLIALQVESIRKHCGDPIYVSLPRGFKLDSKDSSLFSKLDLRIIWVDSSLTLGESIGQALGQAPETGKVSILYGDTLIKDLPDGSNCIAIADTNENYNWHVDSESCGTQSVWAGYFNFDSKEFLLDKLKSSESDFLKTVQDLLDQGELRKEKVLEWFDAGHINTYFHARSILTTERCFNSISIENNVVTKKSAHNEKIVAEAHWFLSVPPGIKRLTPNLIEFGTESDSNVFFYSIEYLYYMPLNELAVHGRLPIETWSGIFRACLEYFKEAKKHSVPEELLDALSTERRVLIGQKTISRVAEFEKNTEIHFDQPICFNGHWILPINQIIAELVDLALSVSARFSVIHGDFCFSNIIYDSRSRTIKVIDPRGLTSEGTESIYGDLVYDFAKFIHSVVGYYDFIIAGIYELNIEGQHVDFSVTANEEMDAILDLVSQEPVIEGVSLESVMPLTILLFFSMLPLHSDSSERQNALLANALRLYFEFKGFR